MGLMGFSGLVAKWCPTVCDPMDCRPQFPLSMGFARQEYGSGFVCPPPGDLLAPETEPASPV